MVPASHQTVRLARGRHRSAADGACVMELASMLAGERFTDHPRCVDPVIAAYLRALNDRLDARRRQTLVPYAPAVVGTRGERRERRARRRACRQVAGSLWRVRYGLRCSPGEAAARALIARGDDGLAFLERLIGSEAAPLALPVAPVTQERVAAPVA